MKPVALLTPTYGRDLEICTLLCESVDRHVTSFSKHYLLVPDTDLPLFAPLASPSPPPSAVGRCDDKSSSTQSIPLHRQWREQSHRQWRQWRLHCQRSSQRQSHQKWHQN